LTTLTYDNQGNLINLGFPDHSSLTYQYDLLGRITNAFDGAGHAFALGYNNQGIVTAVNSSYGTVQQTLYDALNRPVTVTDANGITVTNQYDALNELLTRTWPDGLGEGYGYSAAGLIAHTNSDQQVTLLGRDAAGRLTSALNANRELTQFGYDSLDHVTFLIDGLQHWTSWQYNEYGWLTNKVDSDGRQVFRYAYDANGRLQSRWTPEKGGTAYAYDPMGNLTNVFYGRSTISYAYDALNRLTNMVDGVGTTAFGYTPASQLQSETGPWANDTVTNGYTQQFRTVFGLAQPGGWWLQSFLYDAAGRLTNVVSPAGTFNYVLGGHGAASPLVKSLSLPNGGSITNGYDALAQLQETALNSSSGATLDGYGYESDPVGLRTNITRNFGTAESTVSLAYDALGQLTNFVAQEGTGGALRLNEQLSWGYDAAHNLHTRANNVLTETFTVDAANQLTGLARNGSLTVEGNTLAGVTSLMVNGQTAQVYGDFTFAQSGNALYSGVNMFTNIAQNVAGKTVTNTLTVNLPANATVFYDNNGNLTNDGLRSFAYDTENELTNVQVAGRWQSAFVYDGLCRRRIERDFTWSSGTWVRTNEVHYVYDGRLILQERDASNNVVVTYSRGQDLSGQTGSALNGAGGIGGLLARTDAASTNFYHADGSGNITALVDGSQTIVARYLYNPFGQIEGKWGPLADANTMQFSSMSHHNLSGLSLYPFRAYDPSFQRWLNRDPIEEEGGINLYGYVNNNAINEIDPFGLDYAAAAEALGEGASAVETEEAAGWLFGGNFNPGVDVPIIATAVGALGYAGWEYFQPTTVCQAEHTKNARPSTEGPHQKGRKRLKMDKGGEKGDARRAPKDVPPMGPKIKPPYPPNKGPKIKP
jgi:RHS repeat-associated protein